MGCKDNALQESAVGAVVKGFRRPRYTTSTAFPHPLAVHRRRLAHSSRIHLNLCWLGLMPQWCSTHGAIAFLVIWSIPFPGTEVRLIGL